MAVTIPKTSALAQLSLTPLIDVVFLLIIFFLVATRFAEEEREMRLALPEASEAQPLTSPPIQLSINIDEEGRYYVKHRLLSIDQLQRELDTAYVNNPGRVSAVIRADRGCRWEFVVAAMAACNRAKIRDYTTTVLPRGD